jgi:hypothetical protein
MSQTTPFIRRMRTTGGTFYAFTSSVEDIGLNINERNNIVKMSHYALLNIPSIVAPDNFQQNKFNVLAIPGAYQSFLTSGSIKDGRVIVAESFQNYALNLESNLLSQSSYNAAATTTVSERVFWKWLKETGAIRWQPINTSAGTYWKEEIDTDTSIGYNSIVKCIGTISAGSVRTDTFGTYNETYILVPTSFGQTPVYFKQVEDDNYFSGLSILNGETNILGRETYLYPHPDALDFKAYYDLADSSIWMTTYAMQYDDSTGWTSGWWWKAEDFDIKKHNDYYIDVSSYINTGLYNINLRYNTVISPPTYISFKRSKVDCMSIEYDLDKLKTIFSDPTLTFDDLAIEYAEDDNFDFNSVLIYYSIYNKTLDKTLATNLLGILFLDPPSGNTASYPIGEITLPSITKLQSGVTGFGTSYSVRLNIKSDYMLDDTQAIVTDTTASQQVLEDFTTIFDNLSRTLAILNQHTGTINYITEQYLDITTNQTNILNKINDIEYRVNDIARDITGTENTIAMFSDGDDPLIDSSIYMKNGKIGFFTNSPEYAVQFDVSVKVKDLIIENAIRDTSGNILISYGSPMQFGSAVINRPMLFYSGPGGALLTMNSSNNVIFDASITFRRTVVFDGSLLTSAGTPITGGGTGDVTKAYTDASLVTRDGKISANDASIYIVKGSYIPSVSIGSGLSWVAGTLRAAGGGGGSGLDVSAYGYIDGSFGTRDLLIFALNTSTKTYATNASVNIVIATNASVNAAIANYSTNASVNIALSNAFVTNVSLGSVSQLTKALNSSLGLYAIIASPTFTGTPVAPTNSTATDNTTQISTDQFVQTRVAITDVNLEKTDASLYNVAGSLTKTDTSLYGRTVVFNASVGTLTTSLIKTDTSLYNVTGSLTKTDTSLYGRTVVFNASIGALNASINSLWSKSGNIGTWNFILSGNDLLLKYGTTTLFKFTSDGSLLATGELTAKSTTI